MNTHCFKIRLSVCLSVCVSTWGRMNPSRVTISATNYCRLFLCCVSSLINETCFFSGQEIDTQCLILLVAFMYLLLENILLLHPLWYHYYWCIFSGILRLIADHQDYRNYLSSGNDGKGDLYVGGSRWVAFKFHIEIESGGVFHLHFFFASLFLSIFFLSSFFPWFFRFFFWPTFVADGKAASSNARSHRTSITRRQETKKWRPIIIKKMAKWKIDWIDIGTKLGRSWARSTRCCSYGHIFG